MIKENILLVGTGQMAIDYLKVLKAINKEVTVIGRGQESAIKFEKETGVKCHTGGIKKYIEEYGLPLNSYVIVATGTEALLESLLLVLVAGAEKVLIEKPAALSIEELVKNEMKLEPYLEKVFVAYNRRFYSSVIEAQKLIEEDGGLKSMHFEFTEWAHTIEPLQKAPGVKENWFFANSTHIVDLAFYLAGKPLDWKAYCKDGKLTWHNKSNFVGAGITDRGVLFSYISNWESAGRWAIELLTEKRRIYLKPVESVGIQNKGTINILDYDYDNTYDLEFKPGLFLQVDSFLNNNSKSLKNISEHISDSKNIYSKMINKDF